MRKKVFAEHVESKAFKAVKVSFVKMRVRYSHMILCVIEFESNDLRPPFDCVANEISN